MLVPTICRPSATPAILVAAAAMPYKILCFCCFALLQRLL
jgi:hypothetical protein